MTRTVSKPCSLIVVVLSLAGSASSGEKACLLNFDSRCDYGLPQMMCELGKRSFSKERGGRGYTCKSLRVNEPLSSAGGVAIWPRRRGRQFVGVCLWLVLNFLNCSIQLFLFSF